MMNDKATIIAVDMDGTLCKEVCWDERACVHATPNHKMINLVNQLSKTKHIVIYTARKDNLIPVTLQWLRLHDVHFDAISNKKMPADIYIDDKAIHVDDTKSLDVLAKSKNWYDTN